jgi:hypothetical protein
MWAPLIARHMSKRYSILHIVFTNITSVNVAIFCVSLSCSIISRGVWLSEILRLCYFTLPSKWNFASSEKTCWAQESLINAHFLRHFFIKSLPIFYQGKTADFRNLLHRLTEAILALTEIMFVNSWREIEYRFDVSGATNCAYIGT